MGGGGDGGVIRPRRCMGVWVYKAAPLCWAGRTPPAESGQWIWWRPHQGWRRLGHPLHTAGISRCRREEKRKMWTILPMWLVLEMTDILLLPPFYDFRWPLVCCLSVMLIILIIIKHQWVHTGSIWKCLIFWWWHNVSTNALGLLWLTLTRNNLCSKREAGHVKNKQQTEKRNVFLLGFYSHSVDRKTYPSTCPCWWMMRWDSSLVILPWNHSWAIWMTAEKSHMFKIKL